jgi:hypothetical protein
MAAPVKINRIAPSGLKYLDGFPTYFVLGNVPALDLWEKSVKPPGVDIGDMIDITDMFNKKVRTYVFRILKKWLGGEHKCAFEDSSIAHMKQQVGVNQNCCVIFPNGAAIAFWGGIKSFVMDAFEEGKQPEATVVFEVTNWDPANNVEADPIVFPASGTGT